MQIKYLPKSLYTNAYYGNRIECYKTYPEINIRIEILERFERLVEREKIPVRRAASYCGVSLATIYRWCKCYHQHGILGLRNKSRRPHNTRRCQWQREWIEAIIRLKQEHRHWGKATKSFRI